MGYLGSNIPVFIILLSLFIFICMDFYKLKALKNRVIFALIGVLCFFLGTAYFNLSSEYFFNKTKNYEKSFKIDLSGTVTGNISSSLNSQNFTLKTKEGFKVNISYSGDVKVLPGDIVEIDDIYINKTNNKNFLIPQNRSLISEKTHFYSLYRGNKLKITGTDKAYFLERTFYRIRKNTFYNLLKYLSYDEAAFSYSVISSDKAYISDELYDMLVSSGLLHLCTVSGFHFTFLCMFLIFITASFVKLYRPRLLIVLVSASVFILYTGFLTSVLRAYVMFLAVKICDLFYVKHISSRLTLLFTACLFIVINPFVIYDYSFILTFGAMAGLVFILPVFNRVFEDKRFFGNTYCASALSVNMVMLPICYSLFGRISLWGFITNFFAETAIATLMIFVIAISFLSEICGWIGVILSPFLKLLIRYVFLVMSVSKLKLNLRLSFFLPLMCAVIFVMTLYFVIKVIFINKKRRKAVVSLVICTIFLICCYSSYFLDSNAYITYMGDTNGIDVVYKNTHYVFCNVEDINVYPRGVAFSQNDKIKTLFILDSTKNSCEDIKDFLDMYNVDEVYVNDKMYSYLLKEDELFTKDRIKCVTSYKDNFISINNDEKLEFMIHGKRFVISPNIKYVSRKVEDERDCTVFLCDYDNEKYRKLINLIEFDKSVTPIIRSNGYEKLICTGEYSLIRVDKNGEIYVD